jgi:hypothetical protein
MYKPKNLQQSKSPNRYLSPSMSYTPQPPPGKRKEPLPKFHRQSSRKHSSYSSHHHYPGKSSNHSRSPTWQRQQELLFEAKFEHELEIQKLKTLLLENEDESYMLTEVNDLVSLAITKSQSLLETADHLLLENANARPPSAYERALEKLLQTSSHAEPIMFLQNPMKKAIPLYRRKLIEYNVSDNNNNNNNGDAINNANSGATNNTPFLPHIHQTTVNSGT